MSDISIEVDGLTKVQEALEDKKRQIENPERWYVGTHVEYSVISMPSLNRAKSGKRYVAS